MTAISRLGATTTGANSGGTMDPLGGGLAKTSGDNPHPELIEDGNRSSKGNQNVGRGGIARSIRGVGEGFATYG